MTPTNARTRTLRDIRIFPYYRGVPLEVDSVAHANRGIYGTGFFAGQSYYTLQLEDWSWMQEVHVGATYTCMAHDEHGGSIKTHWLYCTSAARPLTFSNSQYWSTPDSFSPLLPSNDTSLVRLEELSDIVAVFPGSTGGEQVVQANIGRSGWLVMTRIGCPHRIGVMVDDPILPTHLCQGESDIVITARSVRTTQSITLDALSCVKTADQAIFLRLKG